MEIQNPRSSEGLRKSTEPLAVISPKTEEVVLDVTGWTLQPNTGTIFLLYS